MATFIGESVVNVVNVTGSTTSSPTTVYTVPAGRYAVFYLRRLTHSSSAVGAFAQIRGGSSQGFLSVPGGANAGLTSEITFFLDTAQTVEISIADSGTVAVDALVLEYNKP